MLTSEKMITDIYRLDYCENDNEVIILILKEYLPKIQSLEKQQMELVEALEDLLLHKCEFCRDKTYKYANEDGSCKCVNWKYRKLLEKILNKSWEQINE